jgi:hypothetical protein
MASRRGRPLGGSDEGRYDPRKGAQGYAPIVASFGALAVTAIVVVFTIPSNKTTTENLTLTTGLLAIAVFASFLGAFGLAAVGAEDDPTANLPATVMFMAIPVALAFIGILGAFEVLAATYVPESATLFTVITAAGGASSVLFSGFVVGDSWSMHPTRMDSVAFGVWRSRQWIRSQQDAKHATNLIVGVGMIPVVIVMILRISGAHLDSFFGLAGINALIYVGIAATIAGTGAALSRARHPDTGNDQVGLRQWEAWTCTMGLSVYTFWLVLVLPV